MLISTGKSDWAREVTAVDGSLAKLLSDADGRLGKKKAKERSNSEAVRGPSLAYDRFRMLTDEMGLGQEAPVD